MGDADTAIAEYDKALRYAPNNPNTLFSRGLVKWRGKADGAGAIADWQKLVAMDPNCKQKHNLHQMLAEVRNSGRAPSPGPNRQERELTEWRGRARGGPC